MEVFGMATTEDSGQPVAVSGDDSHVVHVEGEHVAAVVRVDDPEAMAPGDIQSQLDEATRIAFEQAAARRAHVETPSVLRDFERLAMEGSE